MCHMRYTQSGDRICWNRKDSRIRELLSSDLNLEYGKLKSFAAPSLVLSKIFFYISGHNF